MATSNTALQKKPIETGRLTRQLLEKQNYRDRFHELLKERAPQFMISVINAASAPHLQGCEPNALIQESMKAAALDLSIEPSLGLACIVPFRTKGVKVPQFQTMWRGVVQLAMRSGAYERIIAQPINEEAYNGTDDFGEPVVDFGQIDETKEPVGFYFAWKLTNGFVKKAYWSKAKCLDHGKRFSKSYQNDLRDGKKDSLWSTNPNAMCMKTVVKMELSRWGILSVQMRRALEHDEAADTGSTSDTAAARVLISEGDRAGLVSLKNAVNCPDDKLGEILTSFGYSVLADVEQNDLEAVRLAVGSWNSGEIEEEPGAPAPEPEPTTNAPQPEGKVLPGPNPQDRESMIRQCELLVADCEALGVPGSDLRELVKKHKVANLVSCKTAGIMAWSEALRARKKQAEVALPA